LLAGTLYGGGESGVILAPAYPGGQEGWKLFAETIAAQGYRALTFDFRGQGGSEGTASIANATTDLMAAITFMREQVMVDRIVLMGAGWGGTAAIRVASQNTGIIGLAVLSAPRSVGELEVSDTDLVSLTLPTLWLAARNDLGQDIEAMADQVASPDKTIWVYEGSSLHGTYIFEGANGPDLTRRLLEFINRLFGT
jgi:pimeloyl-ACP methyl ester carboxylesterase